MRPTSPAELSAFYERVRATNGGEWPDFEPSIQRIYERLLHTGDAAIDGGAAVGRHTVPMAHSVAPGGVVFAFEPLREFVWRLRAKALTSAPRVRRAVHVHQMALSASNGVCDFEVTAELAYSGIRQRIYPRPDMRVRSQRVRKGKLDDLIRPGEAIKFIKLDLEGGEFDAMRGGLGLIETHRPVIVFEYDYHNTPRFYYYRHADLLEFFDRLDYRLMDILGNRFDDPAMWGAAEAWYYVAVPSESDSRSMICNAIEPEVGM